MKKFALWSLGYIEENTMSSHIHKSGVISAPLETWDDGTVNVKKTHSEILFIFIFAYSARDLSLY